VPECCYLRERHIQENEDTIKWLDKLGIDHNRLIYLRTAVQVEKDEFKRHKVECHSKMNHPEDDLRDILFAIKQFRDRYDVDAYTTLSDHLFESYKGLKDLALKIEKKYNKYDQVV
jgi:hypothetical protein